MTSFLFWCFYARLWAWQQLLQSGLFEFVQQAFSGNLLSTGTFNSFGKKGLLLVPLVAYLLWKTSVGLPLPGQHQQASSCTKNIMIALVLGHILTIGFVMYDAPGVWDYQYWCLQFELSFLLVVFAHFTTSATNVGAVWDLCWKDFRFLTQLQLVIFYVATAFWKYNSAFLDPSVSCAPVLTAQVLTDFANMFFSGIAPKSFLFPHEIATLIVEASPALVTLTESVLAGGFLLWLVVSMGMTTSASQRLAVRVIGAGVVSLGLFFHWLIALCPPPNGAGGFSVAAAVRYFFFFPEACAAALRSSSSPSMDTNVQQSKTVPLLNQESSVHHHSTESKEKPQTVNKSTVLAVFVSLGIFLALAIVRHGADYAILTYTVLLLVFYVRAILTFLAPGADGLHNLLECQQAASNPPTAQMTRHDSRNSGRCKMVTFVYLPLLALALAYGFLFTILGLQDMGAPTMYGMLRVYIPSNHFVAHTGLLFDYCREDLTHSELSNRNDINSSLCRRYLPQDFCDVFSGPTIRVTSTNSTWIASLFPADGTFMLQPAGVSEFLQLGGHTGKMYVAGAARVLGTDWIAPHAIKQGKGQSYLVPTIELRRLIAEARERGEIGFEIKYEKVTTRNAKDILETGEIQIDAVESVHFVDGVSCNVFDVSRKTTTRCDEKEVVFQGPPPWWSRKFMLFFPLHLVRAQSSSVNASPWMKDAGCVA